MRLASPQRRGGAGWGLVVAALVLSQAACLVSVRHVDDPRAELSAAREEAARCEARPGRAHGVNVVVYDPGDRTLVRVSVPLWLARRFEKRIDFGEGGEGALERTVGQRVASKITLKDLAAAGRGLIADVEDDDGGQVLVWLR
jgi:hypothetical protein